ncbi:phage/plasmid primase, P4 family [Bilophila wadsworthia]|uniref:DNA primase family protein n=1 Tax=Bilophila wadsworthia TaxID=35833 RepID=UPI002A831D95|nr:phage/plasmid primase, P4 family [Bilophila wadsworthia]MDY3682369.1 phage/plasmid primase, P4 family [Bilophila wadsworthia]
MNDLSSLASIIRQEVAEERARSFEEAKEKDGGKTIRPDSQIPEGPEEWGVRTVPPPPPPPSLSAMLRHCYRNELGDAELFQSLYRGKYAYDHSTGLWYKFDGVRWQADKVGKVSSSVMEMAQLYENAEFMQSCEVDEAVAKKEAAAEGIKNSGEEDAELKSQALMAEAYKLKKALLKKVEVLSSRANALRSQRRVVSVLKTAAQGESSLGLAGDEWDQHSNLLPCANGIIELDTGKLFKPDPHLYMRGMSPYPYLGLNHGDAFFMEHLDRVFCGVESLIDYFGLSVGCSATGMTHKGFWVGYGPQANNGKSATFDVIKKALGEYAITLKTDVLIDDGKSKNTGPNPEIMALANGARMAVSSEAKRGVKFSINKIKEISGGDVLRDRDMYVGTVEFKPQAKLWLHTNHIPEMDGFDPGFQNRMRVIPFLARFTRKESEIDPARHVYAEMNRDLFDRKMEACGPAILSWIVRNARRFYRGDDFTPPSIVQEYTTEYIEDQDLIGEFLSACCDKGGDLEIQVKHLYAVFKKFCTQEKEIQEKYIRSMKSFAMELAQKGFRKRKSNVVYVVGLDVKETWLGLGDGKE